MHKPWQHKKYSRAYMFTTSVLFTSKIEFITSTQLPVVVDRAIYSTCWDYWQLMIFPKYFHILFLAQDWWHYIEECQLAMKIKLAKDHNSDALFIPYLRCQLKKLITGLCSWYCNTWMVQTCYLTNQELRKSLASYAKNTMKRFTWVKKLHNFQNIFVELLALGEIH